MFSGRPIIGIAGGIGSGKSFVARLFAENGCAVIDSDKLVREAYQDDHVKQQLRQWWGDELIGPDGTVNKRLIAERVFTNAAERQRLEGLLHPKVNAKREREMQQMANNPQVLAFVWDTPLLFETGLNRRCDTVVFVDSPLPARVARVRDRGWNESELLRRENLQWPLDKKRQMSDHIIRNTADAGYARGQVSQVLSRILAQFPAQASA